MRYRFDIEDSSGDLVDPEKTPCAKCQTPIDVYVTFPGGVCLECWAKSAEGKRMPSAEEIPRYVGDSAMTDAVETFKQDGFTVSLFQDDDPMSPGDWDQLATFQHSSGYRFGEEIPAPARGWQVYARALSMFGDDVAAVLPAYIDDYGSRGVLCETDAESCNAVLVTTHKRLTELCGDDPKYHAREWVLDALRGELTEWCQYFEGDVYGYVVKDPSGEHVDSCWGFYGAEYAEKEARYALACCIEYEAQESARVAQAMAI